MNIIPENAILKEYGFDLIRGKSYYHYYKTKCTECGKETYKEYRNTLVSKNAFCSKMCQANFKHKKDDPIGVNILNHENEADFCYLIGLICTDGHITYPPNYVHYSCVISLRDYDKDILEKIYTKFGGRLSFNKKMVIWQLNNNKFIEYLRLIGLTHNKSLTIDMTAWFNMLSDENKLHFMRGVIDGDGSLLKNKNNNWRLCIVSASKKFIEMCSKYLKSTFYKDRNTYVIQLSKKDVVNNILDKIYFNDQSFYLERKYKKYKQQLTERNINESKVL